MSNEIENKSFFATKLNLSKYKLVLVAIALLIFITLMLSSLNQKSQFDLESERIIREAAAMQFSKDPKELTENIINEMPRSLWSEK